jgi:hypothetical protein
LSFFETGRQGLVLYEIILTSEGLFETGDTFDVVDISNPWRPDIKYKQLPRLKVNENYFSGIAKALLSRLEKEFDNCLASLDDDLKVMTMVHPISAGLGIG